MLEEPEKPLEFLPLRLPRRGSEDKLMVHMQLEVAKQEAEMDKMGQRAHWGLLVLSVA